MLRSNKVPSSVAEHIAEHSWRSSSKKTLNSFSNKWIRFCKLKRRPVVSFVVAQVLEFLDFLAKDLNSSVASLKGAKYFACTMAKLCRKPFSQTDHIYLLQYIRGVFNKHPLPVKKSMESWNVDIVLDHLVASGPNLQLGLNYLAAKTVILILMARMCRIGEVAQLNTKFMHEGKNYLEFWLPQPCRTVTVTNHTRQMNLQKLRITQFGDRCLCPVAAMKTYLHRTRAV